MSERNEKQAVTELCQAQSLVWSDFKIWLNLKIRLKFKNLVNILKGQHLKIWSKFEIVVKI